MRPDKMNLNDFETRMQEILDNRGAPEQDEQLVAAASANEDCAQKLAAQELLLVGLELSDLPALPADFAKKVVAAAQVESSTAAGTPSSAPRIDTPNRWLVGLVCSAALLLIAVAGWSLWQSPSADQGGVELVDDSTNQNDNRQPEENSPLVPLDVDALAETDATTSPDQFASSPTEDVDPTAEQYQAIYDAILQLRNEEVLTRPQWVNEVAVGLRPVASSMNGALNVLRNNIPPSNKSSKSEDEPQAGNVTIGVASLS